MRSKKKIAIYLVRVDADGDADGTSETEIGQFDRAVIVDQQVLRLQVAVEHSSLVTEADALAYLE